jgi:hypothetical protein
MLTELLPFSGSIGVGAIAGTALWALSFYLGFSSLADRVIEQCQCWLLRIFSPPTAGAESAPQHEVQLAVLASLGSVIPFLLIGALAYYGLSISLGSSWAVSTGLIACIGSGVYELGRQEGLESR